MDHEENITFESSTSPIEQVFTGNPLKNGFSSLSVTIIIRTVIGVVILVVNNAVLNCISKWTQLKRATRILFLNLAASDIFFLAQLHCSPFSESFHKLDG